MKYANLPNLFNKTDADQLISRVDSLTPSQVSLWGKMTVAQMLAHCAETFEVALNHKEVKPSFMSFTIGPIFKFFYLDENPMKKHAPTTPQFKIQHNPNFEQEKNRLKSLILEFYSGDETKITKNRHAFFGKLTPKEWARGMYKHTNHHLSQFES